MPQIIKNFPRLTAKAVAPPLAHIHLGVFAGTSVARHGVAQLRLVASALAQAEETRPVVSRDVDHAVTLQEGAVGGVVDDAAVGAAPVGLEQLRVVVARLEEVPALPVADLVERGPALQEELQVVRALALGQAELVAAVAVEEATQAPGTVEVGGGEADLQEPRVVVADAQQSLCLRHGAVVVTVDLQAARRVEIWQFHVVTIHLQVISGSQCVSKGDVTLHNIPICWLHRDENIKCFLTQAQYLKARTLLQVGGCSCPLLHFAPQRMCFQ